MVDMQQCLFRLRAGLWVDAAFASMKFDGIHLQTFKGFHL